LVGAQPGVAQCLSPHPGTSFHVKITFAPSGQVTSALVEPDTGSPVPPGLSSKEETCVMQMLRRIKLRPFDSGPVSVGKTYSILP
jgi:hypothetical protein